MKYQFMPMFWGDFLANTMHLTAQEIGAYVLLIAHAWEHGGRVPYENLRRITRIRHDHWPKVWANLEPFFEWEKCPHTGTPTWGTHVRVLGELRHAAEISNKNKDAALRSHSARKANAQQADMHLHLQLPIESLTNGKGRESAAEQPQTPAAPVSPPQPPPIPKPNLPPVIDYRDPGNDYRSPPRPRPAEPAMTAEERHAAALLAVSREPAKPPPKKPETVLERAASKANEDFR